MNRLIELEGMVGNSPVHLTPVQDATLVAHGYQPIPVMAREKRPQIMGWTKGEMTTERIAALRASHLDHISTGLRTGRLVGIDLDIVDPEHIKKVITLAEQVLGPTPLHRFGSKGDLSCYRNETPIPKITIKSGEAMIEILGQGQQFVAFGIHPKTGDAYKWVGSGDPELAKLLEEVPADPLTTLLSALPVVTPEQLRDFAAKAAVLLTELGYPGAKVTGIKVNTKAASETRQDLGYSGAKVTGIKVNTKAAASETRQDLRVNVFRAEKMLDDMVERGFLSVADSGTGHDRCYVVACEMRDLGISETLTNEMMLDRWYKFCTPNDDKSFVKERVASTFKPGGAQNEAGAYACAPAAETFAGTNFKTDEPAPRSNIQLVEGELIRAVNKAEAALIDRGANIYTFGTLLVRPGIAQYTVAGGDKDRGVRLIPMTKPAMLEAFSNEALFWRFDQRAEEWRRKDCPDKIAEIYLAREGGWKLRKLTGVIHAPTLRHDGSILETPGYDTRTGLLYDPLGQTYPAIPQSPTKDDAVAALALFKELLKEFPFVDKPSLSVALSAILTGLVRRNLTNAPLHAFTAPAAGTGKSLLVDCAAIVATGKPMPVIAQGASEEETAKRLGADLIAGSPFVSLDNCTDALSGALLCQVLTQETVKVRVLGLSKNVDVLANMMVFANGNNLTVAGDLTRRVIMGTLDSKMERPELRHFSGKPDDIIRANRGRYVVAALTVLRAFVVAGSPPQTPPLGSYEEWSHLVRDALVWCGEADPCATMDALTASDPEREDLGRLLYFWNAVIGYERVTVKKVIAATSGDTTDAKTGLHEALGAIAGHAGGRGTDAIDHKKLGHYLARHQGQVINGMSLVRAGITDGTVAWQLYRKKEV